MAESTVTKACPQCGESFSRSPAQAAKQTHCSRECMREAQRTLAPCPTCGGPRRRDTQTYCSRSCKPSVKITKRCALCLAPFEAYRSDAERRYCSRDCYAAALAIRQKGKRSHLWRGGRLAESDRIRKHPAYTAWRQKVFARDEHTCQSCFARGGQMTAHHIARFADEPRLRLKVSNGITLCRSCHADFHANAAAVAVQERSLADRVERFLAAEPGVWHLKIHGSGSQRSGIPDFLICVAGRMMACELKVLPNFAAPIQQHEIKRINGAGGIARVCRSLEDIAVLIDTIKALEGRTTPE